MSSDVFNRQLCEFLGFATTPFHDVAEMTRQLAAGGFVALEMKAAGFVFYVSANGVWLVDAVPSEFLKELPPGQS